MRKPKLLIALCLVLGQLSFTHTAAHTFSFGTKTNPSGRTIEVDNQGIIIDGHHTVPVMGEMHYSRIPESEWRREISKMRAGGITILSTYVFWIHHEENQGVWDWSGNRNLHKFLQICKEEQMPVVLRIGPFCHGEVYQGGFPTWLTDLATSNPSQYKLRSLAPGFIDATHLLYANIYGQAKDYLWKNGGTIIGIQIENESRGPWAYYKKLKDIAVSVGFDVPFYTRTGWPKLNGGEGEFGALLPLYGDYADGFWDRVLTDMPGDYASAFIMKDTRLSSVIATESLGLGQDTKMNQSDLQYPYLTCELGGGMTVAYHRRLFMTGREPLPLAICKVGSGSNLPGYYMYHGGSNAYNPKHTMAECQASATTAYNDLPHISYDFQAPLGEMGQLNTEAFHQTRWFHQFLSDWGEELCAMPVDSLSQHYSRRGCFIFRNDYVRIHNEGGSASVTPIDMKWQGLSITSSTVQPFAKTDNSIYFISVPDARRHSVNVDGKAYSIKSDKPLNIRGKTFILLSPAKARSAFMIDGVMHYAKHGGILYKGTYGEIIEEAWVDCPDLHVAHSMTRSHRGLRNVQMGNAKVAEQPSDSDFADKAAMWDISIPETMLPCAKAEDYYLSISYRGDCARIYADGELINDNFWNGKPMLVRLSQLIGRKVTLQVLPLGRDYPIYFQQEQRRVIDSAPDGILLELDGISIIHRQTDWDNIDLSGQWQFCIDRNDDGERNGWYKSGYLFPESVSLPGSMTDNLKGDVPSLTTPWVGALYDSSFYFNPKMAPYRNSENLKFPFFLTPLRHYVGKAWYKRDIVISDTTDITGWELFLERPHIISRVWINGQPLVPAHDTICNSLSVPHVHKLSNLLHHGTNTIAICIDNDPDKVCVGKDSHSVTDQTQGCWNGIIGDMQLRPFNPVRDCQVYPDIDTHTARIVLTLQGIGSDQDASISLRATSFNTDCHHSVFSGVTNVKLRNSSETKLELLLDMGEGMLLWDEFNPQLYNLQVQVESASRTYAHHTVFGMRKVEIRDRMFYVNGREVQLRGNVENCVFPLTGYPPTDLESWLQVFRRCREFGLNHMRFHSYCPPEAAFLAADMTGFYIQPEGPSWPNHGVRLGRGEYIDTYLYTEALAICREYGNHPSFMFYAFGNEPAGNWVQWCNEHIPMLQQADSRHLYPGFSVGGGWAWQPKSEFAVKAGARGLSEWTKSAPESLINFKDKITTYNGKDMPGTPITIPFVTHEMGQWCVFPNFNEINKYTGSLRAGNFEIFRDLMQANGMADLGNDFLFASGKLQALCYKFETERILRTPRYAGFQILSINDYPGQGTALVGVTDAFYGDKGYCDASDFREFCSPIVPLARIPKFTYTTDETFSADVELYQYSSSALSGVNPQWTITSCEDSSIIASGEFGSQNLPIGQNIPLGQVSVPLNQVKEAGKYTLAVTIPGTSAHNHWDFWVYPSQVVTPLPDRKGMIGNVYVTDTLDSKAIRILSRGGNVLICAAGKVRYGSDIVQQFFPVFWNTSWFKMRPPHTTGILVSNQHPVFKDFPTDRHSDLQWWELVNKAQVMQFDEFGTSFQPLVHSIDTWFISRKIGMLFEARVLKGKLMMTTFDITSNLSDRIVARQLRNSILNYMNSDEFQPSETLSPEVISHLFTNDAPKVDMFTKDTPDELKPALKPHLGL